MLNRRRFLARAAAATVGLVGGVPAVRSDVRDHLPGGNVVKGMVTPETEKAIERGLVYLSQRQAGDGSFGTGLYLGNVAVTSLAGLALMAGGHQPGRGKYGKIVTNALEYVLSQEDRNIPGFLHRTVNEHGPMYSHGFGTLFLAEAYGMVHEKDQRRRLRETLGRAVKLIVNSQNVQGGWRYTPDSREADISVTICQIMALRAARNAGFSVPKSTVDNCVKYVKLCQQPGNDGGFSYMAQGGGPAFARTAAGVVALYSAGIYKGPEVESGLKYLQRFKPGGWPRADMHYFYGHYYAVQAMWTAGGDYWTEWYPAIRDELLSRAKLRDDGSWTDQICPHYGTAMACIILQLPNNYLPILQK